MREVAIVLALTSIPVTLTAAAKMIPGRYPERAAIWKRFNVRDIQLGDEIDKLPGFVCDNRVGEFHHTCVQFVDDRCKGRKSYARFLSSGSDMPSGQSCFYDSSTGGTYLDGQYQRAPLSAVAVIGTDTYVPRAYEIRYTIPKDALTAESNLGRALYAKYGKPDFSMPPTRMRWNAPGIEDLYVSVECGGVEGPTGDYCSVQAYDGGFLTSERSLKASFDAEQQRKNAPAAPRL